MDKVLPYKPISIRGINERISYPELEISGVPQDSVLDPHPFLIYINDINFEVQSDMRLFADDYVIYRFIRTPSDSFKLRNDLHKIESWCIK